MRKRGARPTEGGRKRRRKWSEGMELRLQMLRLTPIRFCPEIVAVQMRKDMLVCEHYAQSVFDLKPSLTTERTMRGIFLRLRRVRCLRRHEKMLEIVRQRLLTVYVQIVHVTKDDYTAGRIMCYLCPYPRVRPDVLAYGWVSNTSGGEIPTTIHQVRR